MSNGTQIVGILEREVGVQESPLGSNWGPRVSTFIRYSGLNFPIQWCGTGPKWGYGHAGVSDSGVAHPATAVTCQRARAAGIAFGTAGGRIFPPGTILLKCSQHVTTVAYTTKPGYGYCIGFNESQGVRKQYRQYSDWDMAVIPPAIKQPTYEDVKVKRFYLENTKPEVYGPWALKNTREKNIHDYLVKHPKMKGKIRRFQKGMKNGKMGYAFQVGKARLVYGPWMARPGTTFTENDAKAARDRARRSLEKALKHPLRPFSNYTTVRVKRG